MRRSIIVGVAVFSCLLLLTQYISYQRYLILKNAERQYVMHELQAVEERLNSTISHSLSAAKILAFIVSEYGVPAQFDSVAQNILQSTQYIDALLLTHKGVITHSYPRKGNEAAIGFDILSDSVRRQEANRAIERRELFFAGPLELVQGGLGVVGRYPIFEGNSFQGFTIVIIKLNTLLKAMGIDTTQRSAFTYQLSKTNATTQQEEYFLPPASNKNQGLYASIEVPAGDWKIMVTAKSQQRLLFRITFSIVSLLFSLTGGAFAWHLVRQPERLQQLVDEKTALVIDSQNQFRTTLERVSDGFISCDCEWRYRYINAAAEHVLGINASNLIGKNIWEEFPELVQQPIYEAYHKALAEQHYVHVESYLPNREKWIKNHLYPSADGLSVFFQDITQQKKAEEDILRVYKEKEAVLNRISDKVYSLDTEWRYTYLNDAALEDHPSGREATLGKVLWEVHPEVRGTFILEKYQEAVKNMKAVVFESFYAPMKKWFAIKCYPSADGLTVFYQDITERKNSEAIIAINEKRFRALIENSTDGLTVINSDGFVVEMSPSGRKILGYDATEIIGKNRPDLIHPDDQDKVMNAFQAIMVNPKDIKTLEYRHKMPDGSDKWLECTFHNLLTEPSLRAIVLNYRDITERKKAEELLRSSEARIKKIFAADMIGFILWDAQGEILDANDYFLQMVGYTRQELSEGKIRWNTMTPPEYAHLDQDGLNEIATTNICKPFQKEYIRKDGTRVPVLLGAAGFEEGSIEKGVAYILDITELKRAEKQIKESNERLINAQSVAQVGSWETDLATLRVIWSLQTYLIFELDPATFKPTHTTFLEFVHPGDRDKVDKAFTESFHSGNWHDIEHRIVTSSGKIKWVEERWKVFKNEQAPYLAAGTCQDITKRKEAEIEKTLLLHNTEESFILLDNNLSIVSFNNQFYNLYEQHFGFKVEKNKPILDYAHPDRREIVKDIYTNVLAGKTEEAEFSFPLSDGSAKIFSIKYKPARNENNEVIGVFVSKRDITKRRKAELKFQTEKLFSDSVINSLPGIFYLYNDKGVFSRWNKNLEEISGYKAEEIKNMNPLDFYDEDEKPLLKKKIDAVFAYGREEVMAHFYTKEKKKIPYYFSGHKIVIDGVNYLIGVGIDITERINAEKELLIYTEEIKRLTAHLEQVREDERTRIAREVHDELGQQLTGLKMDASWLSKKISSEQPLVHEKLSGMLSLMDHTIKTIRRISSDLRPGILDDLGLVAALEWYGKEFEKKYEIQSVFTSEAGEIPTERQLATTVFRIYQEALTNVARHAQATQVKSIFQRTATDLLLTVQDNGQGFNEKEVKHKGTLGLIGMRERALMVGAELNINSKKGTGTIIQLKIPIA